MQLKVQQCQPIVPKYSYMKFYSRIPDTILRQEYLDTLVWFLSNRLLDRFDLDDYDCMKTSRFTVSITPEGEIRLLIRLDSISIEPFSRKQIVHDGQIIVCQEGSWCVLDEQEFEEQYTRISN